MRRGLFVDRRLAERCRVGPCQRSARWAGYPRRVIGDLLVEDRARQGASDRAAGGSRGAEGIEW